MLDKIQRELEILYEIKCPEQVEEFVVDESTRSRYLHQMPWIAESEEILFVQQTEEEMRVGLLFKPELLNWSRKTEWSQFQSNDFINSGLTHRMGALIEGVSHFVYLMWKAEKEETTTQLELEIQAEIDKFLLLAPYFPTGQINLLLGQLFKNIEWIPSLSDEQFERYESASRLALKYCLYLQQEYFISSKRKERDLYSEVRAFYRMSQSDKIRWIGT